MTEPCSGSMLQRLMKIELGCDNSWLSSRFINHMKGGEYDPDELAERAEPLAVVEQHTDNNLCLPACF